MIVVKRGAVRHNGRLYGAGEIITGLKKKEAQRLLKLGACREIADATAAAAAPEKPAEPAATAAQAANGAPGTAGVADLGLQVDPAATIRK